jgi:hypothetical protein
MKPTRDLTLFFSSSFDQRIPAYFIYHRIILMVDFGRQYPFQSTIPLKKIEALQTASAGQATWYLANTNTTFADRTNDQGVFQVLLCVCM